MKTLGLSLVLFAWSAIAIEIAHAQLPSVRWTPPAIPDTSDAYGNWIFSYSDGSARYYVADTNSLQIMTGPYSTTPSVTITFNKSQNEGYDFQDIPDVTGDGVRDILIPHVTYMAPYYIPNLYGFRIVDGASGNTMWTFDDPTYVYSLVQITDLDHDGKNELVVRRSNQTGNSNSEEIVYATNGVALSAPEANSNIPVSHVLNQNYPNPFNPSTTIEYQLPSRENVNIAIYDNLGRVVKQFVLGPQAAGTHAIRWDGKNEQGAAVASGAYFYQARIGNFVQSKKMLLLK